MVCSYPIDSRNDRRRRGEAAAIANTNAVQSHERSGSKGKATENAGHSSAVPIAVVAIGVIPPHHISVRGRSTFEFAVCGFDSSIQNVRIDAGAIFDVREVVRITNTGALVDPRPVPTGGGLSFAKGGLSVFLNIVNSRVAAECHCSSFRKFN